MTTATDRADWLLYEHDDGRRAVAPSAEAATFAHGEPAWHRVGPVEVHVVPAVAAWLLPDDMEALKRFCETSEDSQPYDVPKERMRRLAELGVIQWCGAARYSMTAFGQYVLDLLPEGWPRLPLKTHADHSAYTNAQIDAAAGVALPDGAKHG